MLRWGCLILFLVLELSADDTSAKAVASSLYEPQMKWDRQDVESPLMTQGLQTKLQSPGNGGVLDSEPSTAGHAVNTFTNKKQNFSEFLQTPSAVNKSLGIRKWSKVASSTNKETSSSKTARLQRIKRSGNLDSKDLFGKLTSIRQDARQIETELPKNPAHQTVVARNVTESHSEHSLKVTHTAKSSSSKTDQSRADPYQVRRQNDTVIKGPDVNDTQTHNATSYKIVLGKNADYIDNSSSHSENTSNNEDEYSLNAPDCQVHEFIQTYPDTSMNPVSYKPNYVTSPYN